MTGYEPCSTPASGVGAGNRDILNGSKELTMPPLFRPYPLASSSLAFQNLPAKLGKKLPKHPVPVVHLGRLAVDQSARGRGLGAILLMDALKRCLEISEKLGLFAVDVKAIDEEAKAFYLKYGCIPLLDDELHLFLPIKTIERVFAKTSEAGDRDQA